MTTNNSLQTLNCNRFGYTCLDNYVIVKVKPTSIENLYVNGFQSNEYTVIESYDFFTKRQKDIHCTVTDRGFYYNETDAFFNKIYDTFGQLTGKYEYADMDGYKTVCYLANGKLHRDNDLPAEICYYEDGNKLYESWYVNGQRHRDGDSPAEICYYEDGNKLSETWVVNEQLHRDGDLPAQIYYHENGNKRSKTWYVNGRRHRDGDQPAKISYYQNGNKRSETWYINDQFCRDGDQPFEILYDEKW